MPSPWLQPVGSPSLPNGAVSLRGVNCSDYADYTLSLFSCLHTDISLFFLGIQTRERTVITVIALQEGMLPCLRRGSFLEMSE